jgi:hypothetical protein
MAFTKKPAVQVTRTRDVEVQEQPNEGTTEVVRTAADRPQRKSRKPFGVPRSKLSVEMLIPGYHMHWVNDTPGRIHEATSNDYEFVSPKEVGVEEKDSKIKRLVGTNEDGSAMYAYLMKIREEWYEEDQVESQKFQDSIDHQIRNGRIEDTGGRYVPQGGISIK